MLSKLVPGVLDVEGRPVSQPRHRHHFSPTFPVGAYLTQPLCHPCRSIEEMQGFLRTCRYVSDRKLFGCDDYWLPPEEFERTRQGDCDCAAMWAWRQLVDMGLEARFVVGRAGGLGGRHAWIFVKLDGEWHALEPFAARFGPRFPQLWTLWYRPEFSVACDDGRIRYFEHKAMKCRVPLRALLSLEWENLTFRARWFPLALAARARRV